MLRRWLQKFLARRMARAMTGKVRPSQTMVAVYTLDHQYAVVRFASRYGTYRDVVADYEQLSRLIAALLSSRREIMEHALQESAVENMDRNPGANETRH